VRLLSINTYRCKAIKETKMSAAKKHFDLERQRDESIGLEFARLRGVELEYTNGKWTDD
jgi:hypothetical protein